MTTEPNDPVDPITQILTDIPPEAHARMDQVEDTIRRHLEMVNKGIESLSLAVQRLRDLDDDTFLVYSAHPSIAAIPEDVFSAMDLLNVNAAQLSAQARLLERKLISTRKAIQQLGSLDG